MNKKAHGSTHHYKLKNPCRNQVEIQINSLDDLIPPDHKVRVIWEFVDQMDASPCFANLHTFFGGDGRPATSPKVLLAVWIYSILDGNISARRLEELCKNHNVYKWLVGGVPINRTMLAEFLSLDPMLFEDLLTNCLAVMFDAGLISDTDFSQDGTKIKANAGFATYRRKEGLEQLKKEIRKYIKQLATESDANAYEKREKAKKERIAKERLSRIEEALKTLEKERSTKKANGEKVRQEPTQEELEEVRASVTDPDARKMKMGDGAFRLAYNVQLATGLSSRVIFGVAVVNTLDPGTAPSMMAKVHSRLKKLNMRPPENWIGDSAYSGKPDVDTAAEVFPACMYYAPPKTRKGIDPKKHLRTDSEAVKNWRDRIGLESIQEIYKLRCSTAEFSNAQMKKRGWREFLVRGLQKVTSFALLQGIAQNIMRYFDLINKKQGSNQLQHI